MAKAKAVPSKEVLLPQTSAKGRGFDHQVDKNDYIIPRAKLLQALSPEVKADGDLQAGMIINSLTQEVLPEIFVPLFWFPTWIRWNPRKKEDRGFDPNFEKGAMIWRSKDPTDPRVIEEAQFGPNGEVPLATKFLNFFSIFPGHTMPVIVSFAKTSYKAGKKLITLASLGGGDMFGRQYKLTSKLEHSEDNDYFVLEVTQVGVIAIESQTFKVSENLYENFKEKPIEVHVEEVTDPEVIEEA